MSCFQVLSLEDVDEETVNMINNLSWTLPPPVGNSDTVRLFFSNTVDVMYNRECLIKLLGEVFVFTANDKGGYSTLGSPTVQKILWLKTIAKVFYFDFTENRTMQKYKKVKILLL